MYLKMHFARLLNSFDFLDIMKYSYMHSVCKIRVGLILIQYGSVAVGFGLLNSE